MNFEYAPDGTLRSVENPLGETLVTFSDEIGRVTDQILPDSGLVSFAYDRSSDPVKYILPHGEEHGFGHNPVGQTERYSAPASGGIPTNTLWTYNTERQPVSTIKPDGTVISNAYDFAGRLATVTASRDGESESIAYTYDDVGRLDFVSRNGGATVLYGYDTFLTEWEESSGKYLWWDYDDDFRVTAVSLYTSDNTFLHGYGLDYDDDGGLVRISDCTYDEDEYGWPVLTMTERLILNRDSATGFLTNTVVGNVADSRSFNGFGEIAGYAVTSSNSPLYSATYTRDALGRVASQTEMLGATTTEKVYDYDVRGRLTSVTTDGVVTEWYAYDLNGNRTNSLAGVSFYDAQDRMTSGTGMSFSYDFNGSQTNRTISLKSTAFSYDLFGQLASVTLPDDRVVSYDRDALSRITAKRIDGIKVKGWIYKDALKPIAETDADGNVVSFFVYGTSALSPDYMEKDGTNYRFIRDVQGSVRLVVDSATGDIAQRLDYDSFGNVLLDTNPGFQPFGFQSGLYDGDTALVQFGARWYDPATGRWLSKDPILLEGGLNLYVFCGNDPVNFADPWGLINVHLYDGLDQGRDDGNAGGYDFKFGAKSTGVFAYSFSGDPDLKGAIAYVRQIKKLGFDIDEIRIWDHGGDTFGQQYGDIALHKLPNAEQDMREIGELMTPNGKIHLMGCAVGGTGGHLQEYANAFGRTTTASSIPVYYNLSNKLFGIYRLFLFTEARKPEVQK